MARRRVVVTGVGLVTPLAPTAPATWARLLAGDTAVRALRETDLPPVSVWCWGGREDKGEMDVACF